MGASWFRPLARVVLPLLAVAAIAWWAARSRAPESSQRFQAPSSPRRQIGDSLGRLTLAGPREPGKRLVVTGRVIDARQLPVAGARIAVYHADGSGSYGSAKTADLAARLSGWLVTDSLGRYELRTVRPGGQGAHIHFVIHRPGGQQAFELQFADDRTARSVPGAFADTGRFATIRPVARGASGVQQVARDFRVR